jgi:WD40 repeat protein
MVMNLRWRRYILALLGSMFVCGCGKEGRKEVMVQKSWPVWAVAFSPEGRFLVAGRGYRDSVAFWPEGGEGEVNVWNVKDWKLHSGFSAPFTFWAGAVGFTPDSKTLIAASNNFIRSNPPKAGGIWGGPSAGAPNPWGGHDVFVWKVPEGALSQHFKIDKGKGRGGIESLAIRKDGELLALGRWNTVPVLQTKTGHLMYELKEIIRWVDFSPDGKTLAAASGLPCVRLYDGANGKKLASFDLKSQELSCLHFSPDGKQIAVGVSDGSVRLLAADLSKQIRCLHVAEEKEKVQSLAFAAKANLLAAATIVKVRLFERSSGKQLQEWGKADLRVTSVALSPDGKLLAVGYGGKHDVKGEFRGGFVQVWDTATGQLVKKLD